MFIFYNLLKIVFGLIFGLQNVLSQDTPVCGRQQIVFPNHTPRGSMVQIGTLPAYKTGGNSKRGIMIVYDLLGLTNNIKQVADLIAEADDYVVIVPDFFRGLPPWTRETFPNVSPTQLQNFLNTRASWNGTIRVNLAASIGFFVHDLKIPQIGIAGFSWGAQMAVNAIAEFNPIIVGALVSPVKVVDADAYRVRVPTYLLPSADEADMSIFDEALRYKFKGNSGYYHFDLPNGFAGGLGRFDNPDTAEAVADVVNTIATFFDVTLK